jgi:hypothetical protein
MGTLNEQVLHESVMNAGYVITSEVLSCHVICATWHNL